MQNTVVKHQWQIELGKYRVETLKSVSQLSLKQEYIQSFQVSPTGMLLPLLILGAPSFFGTVTLTRVMDKSEEFTQWIKDSMDPSTTDESAQSVTLTYVNSQNSAIRRLQLEGARASNWNGPDLSAGATDAAEESLELSFVSVQLAR